MHDGRMALLSGRLLVATPVIGAGPFWRSVVFILDHNDEGALGVIVNRPLNAAVADVLPQWADAVTAPTQLFDGGPVGSDSALALGVVPENLSATSGGYPYPDGWHQMADRVGLVDLDGPVPVSGQFSGLRVFAGYAGWDADQLEAEIEEGSWFVVDAVESDLSSPHPETLWQDVLMRQPGDLRLMASFPPDPDLN